VRGRRSSGMLRNADFDGERRWMRRLSSLTRSNAVARGAHGPDCSWSSAALFAKCAHTLPPGQFEVLAVGTRRGITMVRLLSRDHHHGHRDNLPPEDGSDRGGRSHPAKMAVVIGGIGGGPSGITDRMNWDTCKLRQNFSGSPYIGRSRGRDAGDPYRYRRWSGYPSIAAVPNNPRERRDGVNKRHSRPAVRFQRPARR
jgi:hypothetical protein